MDKIIDFLTKCLEYFLIGATILFSMSLVTIGLTLLLVVLYNLIILI